MIVRHLYNRIRTVFFGMTIFSEIIRFLNLEVIFSAVIVKNSFISIQYHFGILVKLRLKKIILFCKDFQCTVNVIELAVRLFKA